MCSDNSTVKIERYLGVGDDWAIGYGWTLYKIYVFEKDENCTLTIKMRNENETFVINKNQPKFQEKKYFGVYSRKRYFAIEPSKPLDESYDNFSIYLNCRKEKCQLENIRVKCN